jgi:hypothetical protein
MVDDEVGSRMIRIEIKQVRIVKSETAGSFVRKLRVSITKR